ncbi:MAG: helix-turn-helix domain-containing protein [Gaiellaceae bacterium]|jgi:excisionase family DNA binding protein
MTNGKSLYLKASEVAEILGMDVSTIYKMCAENVIPSIRVGEKAVRIPRAAFEAYLNREERRARSRALLDEARQVEGDAIETLERQAQSFHERTGRSAHQFAKHWRENEIEDTAENASFLIEALALREALDRAGIGDRVLA